MLDPGVSDLDERHILAQAFANATFSTEETYAVRRGGTFVCEYARRDNQGQLTVGEPEDPNHLLGAFPWLFPYAMGGFEVDRPVQLSYEAQAKWALRFFDRRFRLDLLFMFQVFGVIQKRQVCRSAVMQIHKKDFIRHQETFMHLTPEDLKQASVEEDQHQEISNPTIRSLRKHLTAVRAKVVGTDESRTRIRSLVWGMVIKKNPPSLWITINPSDSNDPVAQIFTGAEINLNRFISSSGPDAHDRAVRVAQDPYAAAKFFHFTIHLVLETLFGISSLEGKI